MAQDGEINDLPDTRRVYAAPALEKGFNVIELLADTPHGLTISEIAARLGLSISEIFRVIMVMERRAWLRKGSGDRFRVTPKVLDLAFRATPAEELSVVAAPVMYDLAQRIGQSCHLVVRNEDQGLVILRQEGPGPTGLSVRVGASLSLEKSCSGHVLLAFSSRHAPVGGALEARLEAVRTQGFEMTDSARTLGVTDISYPVFGFDGHVAAALTVPFLKLIDGTQTVDKHEASGHLARAAARISAGLGGPESKF
ncbi:MAG: IclR family transcriptional regulator [Asticcacaulis sp.]|nr:IclR family transcriptional regulator [Asticcacaulis sp.]